MLFVQFLHLQHLLQKQSPYQYIQTLNYEIIFQHLIERQKEIQVPWQTFPMVYSWTSSTNSKLQVPIWPDFQFITYMAPMSRACKLFPSSNLFLTFFSCCLIFTMKKFCNTTSMVEKSTCSINTTKNLK